MGPARQVTLDEMLARIAANHFHELFKREVDSGVRACGGHLPAKLPTNPADHNVEVKGPGQEVTSLCRHVIGNHVG